MTVDDVPIEPDPPFGATVRALPYPVIVATPDGAVAYANPAATTYLGTQSLIGSNVGDLRLVFADDGADLAECLASGVDVEDRTASMTIRAARRWLRCTLRHVSDLGDTIGPGVLLSMVDVTADHRAADELRWQTQHDYLTGLLNPAGLMAATESLLARPWGVRWPRFCCR